jgi:hypothetical protein
MLMNLKLNIYRILMSPYEENANVNVAMPSVGDDMYMKDASGVMYVKQ